MLKLVWVTILIALLATLSLITANAADAAGRHGDRFDVSCTFSQSGCTAAARIYKGWFEGDMPLQPDAGANILSIQCQGELIYSNGTLVARESDGDGVHWKILQLDRKRAIDLGSSPFDGNPSRKIVPAKIVSRDAMNASVGSCQIDLNRDY